MKWYKSHNYEFLDEFTPHGAVLTLKPKLFSSDWSPVMVVLKNVPNQNWGPKSSPIKFIFYVLFYRLGKAKSFVR